jgi:uncharacterized protein with NRDE domain
MCLAVWSIGHTRYPWVLAANRDEFFDRPAAPLAWWEPPGAREEVLSGRDLQGGGIWLGLTRRGRLALVTNVREGASPRSGPVSRGTVALEALIAPRLPESVALAWQVGCAGFNLVVGDLGTERFTWLSNRAPAPQSRSQGLHGLSNAALDTPWPKVCRLSSRLQEALDDASPLDVLFDRLLTALRDPAAAPDHELPDTGVGLARERVLSSAFIRSGAPGTDTRAYGTRCSTVVVARHRRDGLHVHVLERSHEFDAQRYSDVAVDFVVR